MKGGTKTGRRRKEVFDLSAHLDRLCRDISGRVPELAHIDPQRVLFTLSRSRAPGRHGIYAKIVPLRFADGRSEKTVRRGFFRETFQMPGLRHEGRDILYLVYVAVPRFLRLPLREKLMTVLHELFHISPAFDGDIRRFPGRNFAHGASRRAFDRRVAELLESYFSAAPPPELLAALDLGEEDWQRGDYQLTGLSVPLPRPVLVRRHLF